MHMVAAFLFNYLTSILDRYNYPILVMKILKAETLSTVFKVTQLGCGMCVPGIYYCDKLLPFQWIKTPVILWSQSTEFRNFNKTWLGDSFTSFGIDWGKSVVFSCLLGQSRGSKKASQTYLWGQGIPGRLCTNGPFFYVVSRHSQVVQPTGQS